MCNFPRRSNFRIIINYHETYTVDYEGNSEARITPASQYVMGVLLTMLRSIYRLSYYIILHVNQYNQMQRHRGHTCTLWPQSIITHDSNLTNPRGRINKQTDEIKIYRALSLISSTNQPSWLRGGGGYRGLTGRGGTMG